MNRASLSAAVAAPLVMVGYPIAGLALAPIAALSLTAAYGRSDLA